MNSKAETQQKTQKTQEASGMSAAQTPIVKALREIRDLNLISFHALPLTNGAAIRNSPFSQDYHDLFGDRLFKIEQTVSGDLFDSFFFPVGPIHQAEQLAAETFGADGTLFVTSGTTVANQIAILALCKPGDRVLVDRQNHQSIHFAFKCMGIAAEYLCPSVECCDSGRSYWSLPHLIDKVLLAQESGAPFSVVALNASSYDGVVYDVPQIIEALLAKGARTRKFLVDEAWGIGNYFLESMAPRTAMAARRLLRDYPDLVVVATQSAHKSISTLRQASMLHYFGPGVAEDLKNARYKIHTTSPSYPILASLDLARAQMQASGKALFGQAAALAAGFADALESDPTLNLFKANPLKPAASMGSHVHQDPTKISVNVSGTGIAAKELRNQLFTRHAIYVSRVTETSLLFNVHIGVTPAMIGALIGALRDLQACASRALPAVDSFIIPYPPGIPIAVPGDPMTSELCDLIKRHQESGNMLVRV